MKLWATTHPQPGVTPAGTLRGVTMAAIGACLGFVLVSSDARAQLNGGPMGNTGHGAIEKPGPDKPAVAAPDAVPGARAREPAAPATRQSVDMSPNEALFDAINRGDTPGVRDALNRGAELDAVNILGLTPMELSVDLGRNDISFLLLSMRPDEDDRRPRLGGRNPAPVAKAAPEMKAGARSKSTASAPVSVQPKQTATPKLFANDGGTPLPAAGFLGFDTKKATN